MNEDREDSSLRDEDEFSEEAEGLAGETSGEIRDGAETPGSQTQDERIAFLEAEIEDKVVDLTKVQDKNMQLTQELQDQEKKLGKCNKEVEQLKAEIKTLRKQLLDEHVSKTEVDKKLMAAEQNLRKLTESFSEQESKLKAERKESNKRLNGMVEVLEDINADNAIPKNGPGHRHGPRLRRHYYGSANSPASPGFKSQIMIPLHMEIDCRGMGAENFPLICDGKVFAKNIATLDKLEILTIRQSITNPSMQSWDYRMASLRKGNYRVEGYLSYIKEGKPLFEPTLLNLGIVMIST
ncbi:MAG TPA: hypothetical protein PL181_12545 [bacterium]|nr:hypothetical protein [bacterium]